MATQARNDSALSLEEIDLSRAELWKEDRFTPLFTRLRAEDPVHFCPESEFGPYWSVTRHADIMLPATTFWERNDVHTPWAGAGHYAIYMKQAIQPMYECRNDMAIFADLAARLGINDYDDRTEEQWLRELTRGAVDDFEAFRENGVARFAAPRDAVAFARQIRDPDNHKFTTPSGKIEIYSMAMAARPDPYGLGAMPPIPTWFEPVEPDAKYPLMLCSPKSRARTHG